VIPLLLRFVLLDMLCCVSPWHDAFSGLQATTYSQEFKMSDALTAGANWISLLASHLCVAWFTLIAWLQDIVPVFSTAGPTAASTFNLVDTCFVMCLAVVLAAVYVPRFFVRKVVKMSLQAAPAGGAASDAATVTPDAGTTTGAGAPAQLLNEASETGTGEVGRGADVSGSETKRGGPASCVVRRNVRGSDGYVLQPSIRMEPQISLKRRARAVSVYLPRPVQLRTLRV
jgi:hypothetical protein